jgi:mono/diheme cytochrome c family protein
MAARPALAALASLGFAACASAPPPDVSAAAVRGRAYAVARCSGCHAVGLKGASTYSAAPKFRDFRTGWTAAGLTLRLERSPVHAGPDMPSRGLNPAEADDLVAYIADLRAGKSVGRGGYTRTLCNPVYWC